MRDSGMFSDKPTVTTSGVVSSMAYAQRMSLKKDAVELTWGVSVNSLIV
jgi:hypothetical protein